LLEQVVLDNQVLGFLVVRQQAVCQLDEFRIGLYPFMRFATVIVAPVTGSLLPNDRLHKTIYTLDDGVAALRTAIRRTLQTRTTAMNTISTLPALLQAFFMDRLLQQRQASSHTVASYRDTIRLLLQYAQRRLGKAPSNPTVSELDTTLLGAFLDYLEHERKNSARSRNVRLAAIHSFFRYVALHAPEHSAVAQRVLAMPSKRYTRSPIGYLTPAEVDALLAAPDLTTWSGRRDRALLTLAVQTGLRAAELIGIRCEDVLLGVGAHVRCEGKGRKSRCTPLSKDTVLVLRSWLRERQGKALEPVFPTTRGNVLSHGFFRTGHRIPSSRTWERLSIYQMHMHAQNHCFVPVADVDPVGDVRTAERIRESFHPLNPV
jgi:site-specific recombinase XerD